MSKIPNIVEMFTSIQGEGVFTGVPSHFIRVSGCNLRCVFKDSVCDTPYSSFKPESTITDEETFVKEFKELMFKYPEVNHVVITGGEPMMYRNILPQFMVMLNDMYSDYVEDGGEFIFTIETNGSLEPMDMSELNVSEYRYPGVIYSISPKLSTSVAEKPGKYNGLNVTQAMIDKHNKTRINIDNLSKYCLYNNYQLKFVYSGPECVEEIKSIIYNIYQNICSKEFFQISIQDINKYVMLMPEGITDEQLSKHRKEAVEVCLNEGWRFTDREHIIIWGDKRGV